MLSEAKHLGERGILHFVQDDGWLGMWFRMTVIGAWFRMTVTGGVAQGDD